MNEILATLATLPFMFILGGMIGLKVKNPHLTMLDCFRLTIDMILSVFRR